MAENVSTIELDEKLFQLEQNFLQELKKIAEERLKLERQTISSARDDLQTGNGINGKAVNETFTVRLESSLGEKLAKSRETADGLEDKLQETRISFENKLKTIDRMKSELDRRENVLVRSIQQIEAYMRAVFYLKQDADNMCGPLRNAANEQNRICRQLTEKTTSWQSKKESLIEAICVFHPAKLSVEKIISDLPDYSSIKDVIEYYLVLELLQEELLVQESQRAEEEPVAERQFEFQSQVPVTFAPKENTLLDLRSTLKNLRQEITQLEEEIDATTLGRVKDDAVRYDFQKWIKKIYSASIEFRPPEKMAGDTLEMLDGIKDFVADALEITERLKTKDAA